jgi:hypothetical protein
MTLAADPIAVALRVADTLESLGVAFTVGGSIASSFAGEPRSTIDIDMVAAIDESHVDHLVAALGSEFYIDEESLRRAIRTRGSTNLIHQSTQFKVDIFIAGGTPLDAQQLARRRPVQLGERTLFVHPPEDILLQKLRWYRRAARSQTGSGGMCWRSSERRDGGSIATTLRNTHPPSLSRISSRVRSPRGEHNAVRYAPNPSPRSTEEALSACVEGHCRAVPVLYLYRAN